MDVRTDGQTNPKCRKTSFLKINLIIYINSYKFILQTNNLDTWPKLGDKNNLRTRQTEVLIDEHL